MKNFVYLVGHSDSNDVLIVDPAWDAVAIRTEVERAGKAISGVVLTHHHHDHVNALAQLLNDVDVPVYAQRTEIDFAESLRDYADNLKPVGAGDRVALGASAAVMVHTPGHTPGSHCLLFEGALFSGDTLFVDACGRCDFAGSDPARMFESLHHTLGKLPATTVLYPGHDYGEVPVSSLQRERSLNPYFSVTTAEAFVAMRNGPRPKR